jgi:cbb3-type cytochrome oxidase subunit 1
MNTFVKNLVDRVGSTVLQSFAGSMTAVAAVGSVGGFADWRTAAISAGVAGALALAKVLGVSASASTPAVVQSGGSVTIDENALVAALAAKLTSKN